MKKIISLITLFSIIFSNNFIYAQNTQISLRDYLIPQCGLTGVEKEISQPIDEEQIRECAQSFRLDFNNLKRCVSFSGIDIQCLQSIIPRSTDIDRLTDCLENALPMTDFAPLPFPGAKGGGGFKFSLKTFFEMLGFQLMMEGIGKLMGLVQNFLSGLGLFSKVPTNDQGAQGIIGKSIEETAKNFVAQIQTAINLGLQDVQNYLVFKIRSTIESLIYNKIIKNFIPDIEQYRFFRMYQAYTRAVDKMLEPYTQNPNISCLPFEVKSCAYKLLREAEAKARGYLDRSQYRSIAKRTFKSISRTKRFEILNKPNCDPSDPQVFQIYTALGLTPKITVAQNSGTLTSQIKPTQSLIAKVEINKPTLLGKAINIFANPFKSINLRLLLGQIGNNTETKEKLIDPISIADNAIETANCNLIFNSTTEKIFKELEAEVSVFTAYTEQPGGVSFMPKTSCLKTDAEAKVESLESQLDELIKKSGTSSVEVQQLRNTIEQFKKIAEQQRKAGVTGESPICIESKNIENPISVYEDLREKITKGPLEFFEKREGSTNVFVSFIRGWIDTELFKLIDKGFSNIYKENNDALFVKTGLDEAYSAKKQNEICNKLERTATGLKESCNNIFLDHQAYFANITKFDLQNKLIEINKIFKLLSDIMNKTSAYYSTITDGLGTVTLNYLPAFPEISNIVEELADYSSKLDNVSSSLLALTTETSGIFNFASSNLSQINTLLQNLENSTLARELASTSDQISTLQNQIENTKREIQQKLNELQREANNQKIISLLTSAQYNIDNIRVKYPRYYYRNHYYDQFGFNIDGINNRFVLGSKEELSFYRYFHPKLINTLASINLQILINTRVHFQFDGGEDTEINRPFLVADLIKTIKAILYNMPQKAVESENQQNLLNAILNQFSNFFNGLATSSLTNNDLENLERFFTNLESIASRTLLHINNSFVNDFPRDSSFALLVNNNEFEFDFREALENFLNISIKMKKILEFSRSNDIINIQRQINELNQQLNDLNDQYNNEINNILRQVGVSRGEIESNFNKIKEIGNRLTELDHQLNEICNGYNGTLNETEAIINARLRNQAAENNPPTEEERGGGGSSSEKNNFGRRLALIIKNLTANIFEPFNLLKPKKIQIK